jgi:putative transposase
MLLSVNRSGLYYKGCDTSVDDITLLNEIRDVWNHHPYYGYRRITPELRSQGYYVNHKRVQRLMLLGGIKAIFPGPNTSRRNQKHVVYPYLLRDLTVDRPNLAWMVDITYLRLQDGFMYLVALIDVYSRYIVGWSLSNTLETDFCVEALHVALLTGKPSMINSDQGCQFTSAEWVNALAVEGIQISMTGKGRCTDNAHIERFWRSLKREEFYLNEYSGVCELRKAIRAYIEFYNHKRWHQALDYKRPAEVYFRQIENKQAREPVDMWTSASHQPAPFGTCGQTLDNENMLSRI